MMPVRDNLRRLRARARSVFAPRPTTVPTRWLSGPLSVAGRRTVLFVTFAPGGQMTDNARYQIAAWQRAGFVVVAVVVMDDLDAAAGQRYDGDQVVLRANAGYDFGAWAGAILTVPDIAQAALLVIANDSVYGPTGGFSAMLDAIDQSPADVVGLTDSHEVTHHLQSYLVAFKPRALRHPVFHRFWHSVRVGGRQHVIDLYEMGMAQRFRDAGLAVAALHPADPGFHGNLSLTAWRALLDRGFPFIKAQLVRENPFGVDIAGWAERMDDLGYDSRIALADLARRK